MMQLPARIGRYELIELLGGGMSQVYRATDTLLDRTVAFKILSEAGNNDKQARDRFLLEARLASKAEHENICKVYDFAEVDGRPYMVMEFLVGESLREALKNNHLGNLRERLNIALQVGRALAYVHQQGTIHRDIKPDNVHLDQNGKAKLMDFGIAKREGMNLTQAGFTLGTPYYMAPEQVMGQNVTTQVDVYAFGILLFEILSGEKPVTGKTVEKIFHQILHEPINLEPLLRFGVPEQVLRLIQRCTSKTAAQRIQSIQEVVRELENVASQPNLAPATAIPFDPNAPRPAASEGSRPNPPTGPATGPAYATGSTPARSATGSIPAVRPAEDAGMMAKFQTMSPIMQGVVSAGLVMLVLGLVYLLVHIAS